MKSRSAARLLRAHLVSSEVIPETNRPGYERGATAALFAGFGAMFLLTATLG